MRALIVDDEPLARRELRRLLQDLTDVQVVGEAADATEAEAKIGTLSPDLLLLDVEMPGSTGFELLERLDPVPYVIFTTAYDEFAIRAFEVDALDYLLKPIEPQRLQSAVDRVRRRLAEEEPGGSGERVLGPSDRVFVRDGERCWFVCLAEITLFESVGNYTRLHFDGNRPLIHRSLRYLEDRLDPRHFFRANRSQIMGLDHVLEVSPGSRDRLEVRLSGGRRVLLSRRRSQLLRARGL